MKVLVTGANGFLAGHIIHFLCQRAYSVRAMIRPSSQAPALSGLNIEYFKGYITQPEDVDRAVEGCSMVIHAAADTSQSGRSVKVYLAVNVEASRTLLAAMEKHGCKRLVYISSANAIGHGDAANPGNEGQPPSPLFMKSGYAKSKYLAQNMFLEAAQKSTIDIIVLNPGFMIGPMDYHPSSGKILLMGLNTRFIPCPPGGKSFIDVRDAAMASVNALEMGKRGSCYLLTGHNLTYHAFFTELRRHSGTKAYIFKIPAFILKCGGALGSLLNIIGLNTSFNYTNASILCIRNYYSNAKAMKELDMPFTDFVSTMRDAVAWIWLQKATIVNPGT